MTAVAFALAASVGGMVRWQASRVAGPSGTALVNVAGAALAGLLSATAAPAATVLATGGLGALTTVSGWINEVDQLWRNGRRRAAAAHLVLTLVAGILAALAGRRLV